MRLLMIFFALFISNCNDGKPEKVQDTSKTDSVEQEEAYPGQIKTNDLQAKYDKVKWALYCIYCDDTCRFVKDSGIKDSVTFASLDLRFDRVLQFSDTTEIYFYFYKDSIKCNLVVIDNNEIAIGAGFKKGNDNISYYISPTTMRYFWENGPHSRYENPLQPEVINYIKNNKGKLNKWFLNEVKRKGITE